MVALLAALALTLLLILQPWEPTSVTPHSLGLVPGPSGGIEPAAPVAPGPALAVASALPAAGGRTTIASVPRGRGEGGAEDKAAIAPARALTSPEVPVAEVPPAAQAPAAIPVASPAPTPTTPPEAAPTPVATTTPAPASAPPSSVSGRVPSNPPSGPIASGPGPGEIGGASLEVEEGGEYALAYSFYVLPTAYRAPGEESSILRLAGAAGEAPTFGLQLWDDGLGQRGLWSSGGAVDGERFLAPLAEGAWHRLVAYFVVGGKDDGLYLLSLDGQSIDARAWVSLLPASGSARLEVGLQREGGAIVGTPDVLIGPVELGESLDSVLP